MERRVALKAPDGKTIYSWLNSRDQGRNKTVALFVHGLTGHPFEHALLQAAHTFPQEGVDTCRVALYADEPNARRLHDCTITTHAQDTTRVVAYLKRAYSQIALVGHSLGSPSILMADTSQVDSIVLWDPSYLAPKHRPHWPTVTYQKKRYLLMEWEVATLLNPAMFKEWCEFDGSQELPLVAKLNKPLKVIAAGKGVLLPGSRDYVRTSTAPAELYIIEHAGHCFTEEGATDTLLRETLAWIQAYVVQ